MVLGAQVTDPRSPDLRLLLPGVTLDAPLIASMRSRGVVQAWVEDDLTKDLDGAVAAELTGARLEVFTRLRDDLATLSRRTVSTMSLQSYRQAVLGLVTQSIASGPYASMTDALFAADGLATHAANVAYLSLLCGLHAEAYVIAEQPRLDRAQARDMAVLGLAGLLHDVGKTKLPPARRGVHEVHLPASEPVPAGAAAPPPGPPEYLSHILLGRDQLEAANAPARVTHTVLNHHQRFDGGGWPDMTKLTGGRFTGPLLGKRIHVYARIVAAANVLDNLLRDAEGRRPPAAALHAFASPRFDGWFDPVVRRAMLLRIPPFAVGSDVKLSDGRRAVVVAPATVAHEPCRPVVRILSDAAGKRAPEADTLNLADAPGVSITHALGEEVARYLYSAPVRVVETPPDEALAA